MYFSFYFLQKFTKFSASDFKFSSQKWYCLAPKKILDYIFLPIEFQCFTRTFSYKMAPNSKLDVEKCINLYKLHVTMPWKFVSHWQDIKCLLTPKAKNKKGWNVVKISAHHQVGYALFHRCHLTIKQSPQEKNFDTSQSQLLNLLYLVSQQSIQLYRC